MKSQQSWEMLWHVNNWVECKYFYGMGVKRAESRGAYHFTLAYGLGSNCDSSRNLGLIFFRGMLDYPKSLALAKHNLEVACVEHDDEGAYYAFRLRTQSTY